MSNCVGWIDGDGQEQMACGDFDDMVEAQKQVNYLNRIELQRKSGDEWFVASSDSECEKKADCCPATTLHHWRKAAGDLLQCTHCDAWRQKTYHDRMKESK